MRDRPAIDLFCEVIDNYGDAGVCWRLARSLAQAGCAVTLWIDDPDRLRRLRPQIDVALETQPIDGFVLRRWCEPAYAGADIVISAFGCRLPDDVLAAMVRQIPPPAWINLEYLSAEEWVEGSHGLPSPHPRLPLTQHFFFPGFTPRTGGLIREAGLEAARDAFGAPERKALLARLGIEVPPDALLVSLFCYPAAPLMALLAAMRSGPRVVCVVPEGVTPLAPPPGQSVTEGALTLHGLPFLEPDAYDRLLWSCDLNFVRGEDSAIRAQWARRPFLWQLYPQQEAAHLEKMQAFLGRYTEALDPGVAAELELCFRAWNGDPTATLDWPALVALLPLLQAHGAIWQRHLSSLPDLGTSLIEFASKIR